MVVIKMFIFKAIVV